MIATAVVLGVAIAAAVAFTLRPVYTATSTLFLSISAPDATLSERSQFASARVASYAQLVRSARVLEGAIDELDLDTTVQELAAHVSARNPANTVNVEVIAESPRPDDAAAIANSVASQLSRLINEVESDGSFQVMLDLLIPANPPRSPSAPQRTVILGLGFIAGLAVGASLALVVHRRDRRIRGVRDVRNATGLPVLGVLPPLRTHQTLAPPLALEAIDGIRSANAGAMPRFLLLAAAGRGAGSQRVLLALGRATAQSGRETLIVETQPPRHGDDFLASKSARGLLEVIAGSAPLRDVVRAVSDRCRLMHLGHETVTEVDAESAMRSVVAKLLGASHIVVSSVAPTTAHPITPRLLSPFADVVVLVARHGRSTENDLAHMLTVLRLAGVTPLGVLLTDVPNAQRIDLAASWLPDDMLNRPLAAQTRVRVPRRVGPAARVHDGLSSASVQTPDEGDADDAADAAASFVPTAEPEAPPGDVVVVSTPDPGELGDSAHRTRTSEQAGE